MKWTIIACVMSIWAAAASAECPNAPDIETRLAELIDKARAAPDERAGRDVSAQMWELWLDAPDEAAQEVLDAGLQRRANYDFAGAVTEYTKLTEYCPKYAEGYNQRAFIRFLQQDYGKALADLDIALSLSPDHVGAQSGRALTLMNMGRLQEARTQLIEALDNNPWLSERHLMLQGGPLGPQGEDI